MSALVARRAVKDRTPSRQPRPFVPRPTRMSNQNTTPSTAAAQPVATHTPPPTTATRPNTPRTPHNLDIGDFDSSLTELDPSMPARNTTITPHDTPSAKTEDGSRCELESIPTKARRYFQYEKQFRGYWVGPVGLPEFLNLLPAVADAMPEMDDRAFSGFNATKTLSQLLVS